MNNVSPLLALANEIRGVIIRWLEKYEGKQFFGNFRQVDLLRLTRLEVWSWRHRVSVEEILTLTLPHLRKMNRGGQRKGYGLGCSVASLTGEGNEKILVNALAQVYPGDEHRDIWRDRERKRQLEAERLDETGGMPVKEKRVVSLLEADSLEDFLEAYKKRTSMNRRRLGDALRSAKRKRKRYRFNPWL